MSEINPIATSNEKKGVLNTTEILSLMANGRARNMYGPKLIEFCESDDPAINPAEVWPIAFGTKEATTLYQGFLGAIKKADLVGVVKALQSDGKCFLFHMEKVNAIALKEFDNGDEDESPEAVEAFNNAETVEGDVDLQPVNAG